MKKFPPIPPPPRGVQCGGEKHLWNDFMPGKSCACGKQCLGWEGDVLVPRKA